MLDKANMVTSYKVYWIMSIIEIITEKEESVIAFEEIVNRMIVQAWYPVVTYMLFKSIMHRIKEKDRNDFYQFYLFFYSFSPLL